VASKRPNIPLDELTEGRIEHLLALVDQWINDIRAHTAEPETDDEADGQADGLAG
jgi:hypothetical protein